MRAWVLILTVVLALLVPNNAETKFNKYDATAVRRINAELRRLGVNLQLASAPDTRNDHQNEPPAVAAPAGDFEGVWTQSQLGRPIAAFEGIPYAQAPVGSLRFKVAQPMMTRLSNFKAKKPGNICFQRHNFNMLNKLVKGNEDCLFINVYVPEKVRRSRSELLPVMFWIHGGGFAVDSGDHYPSNYFLDKDVVLVTFNYRLGPLGFLTTEDDVIPGNLGLKDQVAALRWVHKNIDAFGGNPNHLTVIGQSAGGASAEFLMLSPLTKGLMHRVISLSGSAFSPIATAPPGEMKANVRKAAKHLGCPVQSSDALLKCLLTKTGKEITALDFQFITWGPTHVIPFKPVIEKDVPGALLPHHPKKLFEDGPSNDVPYLTGIVSEEGSFMSCGIFENAARIKEFDKDFSKLGPEMLFLTQPSETTPAIINSLRRAYFTPGPFTKANAIEASNLLTDKYFLWPAIKSEYYRRKGSKSPGYFYYFSYEGSLSFLKFFGVKDNYGVRHADDVLYLFPISKALKPTTTDYFISMLLIDLYTSFAIDSVPSSELIETEWKPVTTKGTDIEYLHIHSPHEISMKKDLLPERWKLMEKLFKTDRD